MTSTIARTKAKQIAILCQAGAVVALAGAAAIVVFGVPGASAESRISTVAQRHAEPAPRAGAGAGEGGGADDTVGSIDEPALVDSSSIAARLALVDNAPIPPETTPDLNTEDDENPVAISEPVSDDGALAKRVRYLGYISDPESPLAFIRIDGAQRIVREGATARAGDDTFEDLEVREVHPTSIVVGLGDQEDRIRLASKSGASIAMTGGGEVEVSSVATREEDVVLTAEELESIAHLPPRQRALQERILKRQKMGKPLRGMDTEPLVRSRANISDGNVTIRNDRRREGQEREPNPDE